MHIFAVENFQEVSFWLWEIRVQFTSKLGKKNLYIYTWVCLSVSKLYSVSGELFQLPKKKCILGALEYLRHLHGRILSFYSNNYWPDRAQRPIFRQLNCALIVFFKSSLRTLFLKFLISYKHKHSIYQICILTIMAFLW